MTSNCPRSMRTTFVAARGHDPSIGYATSNCLKMTWRTTSSSHRTSSFAVSALDLPHDPSSKDPPTDRPSAAPDLHPVTSGAPRGVCWTGEASSRTNTGCSSTEAHPHPVSGADTSHAAVADLPLGQSNLDRSPGEAGGGAGGAYASWERVGARRGLHSR